MKEQQKKNLQMMKVVNEEWLLYKKHCVKKATYYKYSYCVNNYINPYLGEYVLNELTSDLLNQFVDNMTQRMSSKTIKDIMGVTKAILKYIERKFDLDLKIDLITIPKATKSEMTVFSRKQVKKLESFCSKFENNKRDYRNFGIVLCLNTGMRIGEICALKWKDIDMKQDIINVKRTLERIYISKNNTVIVEDEPKTKNSIRKIPISKKVKEILKLMHNKEYHGDEYILTGKTDKFIEPRNYQYFLKKVLETNDIELNNFHALRHTFATECINIGMDIKSLSEILGHANVSITLNRYVHSSMANKRKFLERL